MTAFIGLSSLAAKASSPASAVSFERPVILLYFDILRYLLFTRYANAISRLSCLLNQLLIRVDTAGRVTTVTTAGREWTM